MNRSGPAAFAVAVFIVFVPSAFAADGSPERGQRAFQACTPCHSLSPDTNMTGPSLAGLWHRKAGTLPGFDRYSAALQASKIEWDDKTLDRWIADPQRFVPGNQMTFPGVKNAQQRQDLIAFLKEATRPGAHVSQGGTAAPMGGMMGGGQVPSLKSLGAEDRVQSIAYCKDTYTVVTGDGKAHKFWERNLRLKTDSGKDGPEANAPALVPAGMMGDRADVIFARPDEIAQYIKSGCE